MNSVAHTNKHFFLALLTRQRRRVGAFSSPPRVSHSEACLEEMLLLRICGSYWEEKKTRELEEIQMTFLMLLLGLDSCHICSPSTGPPCNVARPRISGEGHKISYKERGSKSLETTIQSTLPVYKIAPVK